MLIENSPEKKRQATEQKQRMDFEEEPAILQSSKRGRSITGGIKPTQPSQTNTYTLINTDEVGSTYAMPIVPKNDEPLKPSIEVEDSISSGPAYYDLEDSENTAQ